MKMPKRLVIYFAVLSLPAALPAGADSGRIKKCQDARGKWHYGDTAAEECARSKVIELSEQGVKRKVIEAPPTEEELKRRAAEREVLAREKEKAEAQRRRDEMLLSSYGHEDDIVYARDRKLAVIEANIKATEETVKQLRAALERMQAQKAAGGKGAGGELDQSIARTLAQIERHEAVIAAKRREQEEIRKQYEEDLKRYRELKSQAAGRP
jgi:hypothetical protein